MAQLAPVYVAQLLRYGWHKLERFIHERINFLFAGPNDQTKASIGNLFNAKGITEIDASGLVVEKPKLMQKNLLLI